MQSESKSCSCNQQTLLEVSGYQEYCSVCSIICKLSLRQSSSFLQCIKLKLSENLFPETAGFEVDNIDLHMFQI